MYKGIILLSHIVELIIPPELAVTSSTTESCNKEIETLDKVLFFHEGNPKSQILHEDQVVRKSLESGNKLLLLLGLACC